MDNSISLNELKKQFPEAYEKLVKDRQLSQIELSNKDRLMYYCMDTQVDGHPLKVGSRVMFGIWTQKYYGDIVAILGDKVLLEPEDGVYILAQVLSLQSNLTPEEVEMVNAARAATGDTSGSTRAMAEGDPEARDHCPGL